jgi:hypothetical protein
MAESDEKVDTTAIESKMNEISQTLAQISAELSQISSLLSRTLE